MGANGRRFVNTKSQIYFLDPDGMNVGWQTGTGPNGERSYMNSQLVVPARYNFNQGYIYRLKLSNIPGRVGVNLYPTIEVAPTTPATDAYLAHNAIPVQFTAEDFDQVVDGGNFVTKVIYLPDPKYQEVAVSGVETLVSTRLEPGVDPILEADKRGTILLIVRLGAIDLEMPSGPMAGAVGSAPVVGAPISGGVMGAPISGTVVGAPISGVPAGTAAPVTELPPGSHAPGHDTAAAGTCCRCPGRHGPGTSPAAVAPSTAPSPPPPGDTAPAARPAAAPKPPTAPMPAASGREPGPLSKAAWARGWPRG